MHRALTEMLGPRGGPIRRGRDPKLNAQMDVSRRNGELDAVLPGVYAHRDVSRQWLIRAQAVGLWNPRAVVIDDAAAALTFWGKKQPRRVTVAGVRTPISRPGFAFTRQAIPPELTTTRLGVTIATPALTAIDLAPRTDGDSIDDVLRSRMATLKGMHLALELTKGRRGNRDRRQLLFDSRAKPWSSGERRAHCELRAASITCWKANVPIVCDGHTFYQDIVMDDYPLVAEVDGRGHMAPEAFEYDRWRGNLLWLAGQHVLHFTTPMIAGESACFIPIMRRAIASFE